jgi:hypothetical protein
MGTNQLLKDPCCPILSCNDMSCEILSLIIRNKPFLKEGLYPDWLLGNSFGDVL